MSKILDYIFQNLNVKYFLSILEISDHKYNNCRVDIQTLSISVMLPPAMNTLSRCSNHLQTLFGTFCFFLCK